MYRIGLDVGSTTAKIVVLDEDKVIYSSYRRHQANPGAVIKDILVELKEKLLAAKSAGIEVCAVYDKTAEAEQDLIDKIVDYKIDSFEGLIKTLGLESVQSQFKS